METTKKPIDLSSFTADELQAEIERQQKAEKQARAKAKKEYIADKENFLNHSISKFKQIQSEMRQLKEFTISKANELYDRTYTMENKEPKEVQTVTLKNEEDTIKIEVERSPILEFNEHADVHINSIKDIFEAKFKSRNKSMYGYLNDLLIKNSKGDYDPKLITKVRSRALQYGHQDILDELEKLEECRRVTGTSMYCRAYIRGRNKKWEGVSLQFSSL